VETPATLSGNLVGLNGPMNGHSPIPESAVHQMAQAENGLGTTNGQPIDIHFVGNVGESAISTPTSSDADAISAELVEIVDPNGIMLGPTLLHGHSVNSPPREMRSGSPFSGGTQLPPEKLAGLPASGAMQLPPMNLPGNPAVISRPRQESGWYNVLIDAAPYGCLPLVIYALLSAWGAGWSFKAGVVSAFFALCFGLPGLLGPRWKWCLGAMIIAAPILVIASWQILLGR
jgi:hypothetical protein